MKKMMKLSIALLLAMICVANADMVDPTGTGMSLWLKDAGSTYNTETGVWADSSGNVNDASAVGLVSGWGESGITYIAPTLSANGVLFSGQADDLLRSSGLNGGTGLDELTILTVYKAPSIGNAYTRPAGFVSVSAGDQGYTLPPTGNAFNLATDPSVRKDNGAFKNYGTAHPDDVFFVRAVKMDANGVSEWFNTDGTAVSIVTGFGNQFTTLNDNFYLGDLRSGVTPIMGATNTTTDIEIAEVIVYNSALTDGDIVGISEYLYANTVVPEPATMMFLGIGAMSILRKRQ